MQCFAHPESVAVGICRGCGKGVCTRCARDLGAGLACSDACAERVALVESLNRKAGTTYQTARRNLWLAPAYFWIFAAVLIGFGLWDGGRAANFLTVLGVAFVLFGIVAYVRNRSWAREVGGD